MSQTDARTRYTRMVINDCFLTLLQQKPVAKITVTELCQLAQINRATFYRHYLDIPDLMEKLEEELFEKIRQIYQQNSDIYQLFLQLMRFFKNDASKWMVLGSANGNSKLSIKSMEQFIQWAYPFTRTCLPQLSEARLAMLHSALSYGIGGIVLHWIQNRMEQSPEEVADLIFSFCGQIIEGVQKGSIKL